MVDRVGQQLGNYILMRQLGEGGFAEVYLGEHIHLGTKAAIKVLHTQLSSENVDDFRTEARTIARLVHPHIVRVLEFGIEGKTPFLVMDYASHGTLRQRHPKGSVLPLSTVVTYVMQVADALQYAHDEKLIHRDVKPENMLLGARGDVLLSDFGIALVAQSSRYQSTQEMAGTMAYMSPEQIQGKPRAASDQYSLGIVVYEWVTGTRPFHGSAIEIVTQHLAVAPRPLREMVPTIADDVEQVVLTALAKDAKARFGSIQAFATALKQACQTVPSRPLQGYPQEVPLHQPLRSIDEARVATPKQPPLHVPVIAPPSQPTRPSGTATPPGQSIEPLVTAISSVPAPILPSVTRASLAAPTVPQPFNHRFSRRTAIIGLAGLAGLSAIGSGLWWLVTSHPLNRPVTPHPPYTYHSHSDAVRAVAWSPDSTRIASGSGDNTVQVW